MRPSSIRTVARATGTLSRDTPLSHTAAPWICANCRRRSIQTSPSRLEQQPTTQQQQKQRDDETQQQQTHYTFFPQTFPSGPPPATPFTPNLRLLRQEFLQLQSKTHPDLVPTAQKARAETLSAAINEAYRTLQSPLRRAQYLLAQRGIDVEDDGAKLEGGALLMEVMEAREAVEEVAEEAELEGLRAENERRIQASVGVLEVAFAEGDWERARREAVRLRYWMNIEESIRGWEKGKGGGVVHH
ncbi:related to related molecular chaperone [Lecanosticta acicola]|uniref:Related to related molecular chaperone n=1 Tax=Lecanosticta acicola TaxID=111012 RepID=A0AAI8Z7J7_9PEZI|nr:related to related molecular chaperone [Lecanosticta acicola]